MPLKKGKSKAVVSGNISEFHTGKTYAHTAAKFGKARADKQAVAVALNTARRSGSKYAEGGLVQYAKPGKNYKLETGKPPLDPDTVMSLRNEGRNYRGADRGAVIDPANPVLFPWGDRSWDTLHGKGSIDDFVGSNTYAGGGMAGNFNPERSAAYGLARQGMIKSSVPGRTDKLNLNVPSGSYIIPADTVSAVGQGNSDAGSNILGKMLQKGPYGMNLPRAKGGSRVGQRKSSLSKMGFAEGGDVGQTTPIVAAGGEHIVYPEDVARLGNGDIDLGHSILDAFVTHIRNKNIKTLKSLKPPKGSDDAKGN